MNDKWMDDLKNQLGDYRKDAPEGLLDDIEQEMCRRGVMPNQKVPVKKPVIGYKNGKEYHFESIFAASKALGFYTSDISRCCRGLRSDTDGYTWCFEQEG